MTESEKRADQIKETRKAIALIGRLMAKFPGESVPALHLREAREELYNAVDAIDKFRPEGDS